MKEVMEKQEELQRRFLEAIEKREHERMLREEAWRMQEMQRINKEREILAQERSIAAAKDAAVMSFLQKIADQHNLGTHLPPQPPQPPSTANVSVVNPPPPPPPLQTAATTVQQLPILSTPPPAPAPAMQTSMEIVQAKNDNVNVESQNNNNNNNNMMMTPPAAATSSRWPKVEVETLIRLRTNLDSKYQENGPKGPLWEEISAAMRRLGYNRNAKRCKEKWENINKYFKKVKESNKKRPEDSKTCPYFHQLDAIYRERNFKMLAAPPPPPLMVRPEQQWPPPQQQQERGEPQNNEDPMDEDLEEEDKDSEEDEDNEGSSSHYEIVASKPATSE